MLQAIEREHFDQLPGGVFNKGFIRAYAKHLGLDDEEAITDYLASLRQAQIDAHEVWEPATPPPARPASPEKKRAAQAAKPVAKAPAPVGVEELPELQLPRAEDVRPARKNFGSSNFGSSSDGGNFWKFAVFAVVVIGSGVYLWSHRPGKNAALTPGVSAQENVSSPAPAPAETAPAESQPVTSPVSNPPTSSAPAPNPVSAKAEVTTSPAKLKSATQAADTEEASDVTIRTFEKPRTQSAAKSGPLTLIIRARENSWISVLADGQLVTQETLIAPAATSVHASREISVRIGNAAGVTFLFNGNEIPAQGNEAEVKAVIFDESGIRSAPLQAPAPAN